MATPDATAAAPAATETSSGAIPGTSPGAGSTAPATPAGQAPTLPGGEPPAPGAVPGPLDWIGGLDEGSRQIVTTKGWKSPADVLASYAALERTLGAEKLPLPPKDADGNRDWSQWEGWSALGRPESPDAYEFSPVEGGEFTEADQALHAAIKPAAHAAGLAPWQLAELNKAFNAYTEQLYTKAGESAEADRAALQKEWGGQFDRQIALANRVARMAFGDEIDDATKMRMADGKLLLDDARLARAFAKIGAALGEDGGLADAAAAPGAPASPAAAEAEIARIRGEAHGDPKHALNDRHHPEHEALHRRLHELYRLAETAGGGGATV